MIITWVVRVRTLRLDTVAKWSDSVAKWRQNPMVTLAQNRPFLYYSWALNAYAIVLILFEKVVNLLLIRITQNIQLVINYFSGDALCPSRWTKQQVQRFSCPHRGDGRPRAAPILNAVADIWNKHSLTKIFCSGQVRPCGKSSTNNLKWCADSALRKKYRQQNIARKISYS